MGDQLQRMPESNLDLPMTTGELGKIETVKINSMESTPANGLQFATALKARSDGSRPTIEDVIFATVDWADLKVGTSFLDVQHCWNREDRQQPYYSTSITNRSTEKIRIDRFVNGGWWMVDGEW